MSSNNYDILPKLNLQYFLSKLKDKLDALLTKPTFVGTKAQWEALSTSEKAKYDGGIVNLTDDYQADVSIDDTTPALNKVFSSSKVNTDFAKKTDIPIWTSGTSALTGATSCTITDNAISSTSVLEVFTENQSNTQLSTPTITVSNHTATLSFDALEEDTTFYLRVTNL